MQISLKRGVVCYSVAARNAKKGILENKLEAGWDLAMSKVTIELDAKWMKIVRSPLYWVVAALQGVSVSFAPLFLYWSGKGKFFPGSEWLVVPMCFAVILLVFVFYFVLGGVVIRALRKIPSA